VLKLFYPIPQLISTSDERPDIDCIVKVPPLEATLNSYKMDVRMLEINLLFCKFLASLAATGR
jgi:hypothetical protein